MAKLFGYEIDDKDQDWTYTIVEAGRIDEYVKAYDTSVTNEDMKFSLMEMIIQALHDQATDELIKEKWLVIREILNEDFKLYEYTIFYWCFWTAEDLEDCWHSITPLMRKFWIEK